MFFNAPACFYLARHICFRQEKAAGACFLNMPYFIDQLFGLYGAVHKLCNAKLVGRGLDYTGVTRGGGGDGVKNLSKLRLPNLWMAYMSSISRMHQIQMIYACFFIGKRADILFGNIT
jgi:hypothetical protein